MYHLLLCALLIYIIGIFVCLINGHEYNNKV